MMLLSPAIAVSAALANCDPIARAVARALHDFVDEYDLSRDIRWWQRVQCIQGRDFEHLCFDPFVSRADAAAE